MSSFALIFASSTDPDILHMKAQALSIISKHYLPGMRMPSRDMLWEFQLLYPTATDEEVFSILDDLLNGEYLDSII
jgi:hypothetical protein